MPKKHTQKSDNLPLELKKVNQRISNMYQSQNMWNKLVPVKLEYSIQSQIKCILIINKYINCTTNRESIPKSKQILLFLAKAAWKITTLERTSKKTSAKFSTE